MRALAEFVMRGRAQAAIVALCCWIVPFVGPAVVALVTLRRGLLDGFSVAIWALLPWIVFSLLDSALVPLAFIYFSIIVVVMGGAEVLRNVNSWPAASMGLVVLAVTASLVFGSSFDQQSAEFVAAVNEELKRYAEQSGIEPDDLQTITIWFVAGMFGFGIVVDALLSLVLARWWQALLYNPGGFRQEFYSFRLSKTQSLVVLGFGALLIAQMQTAPWGFLVTVPLLMVASAVAHSLVANRRLGTPWLVGFYLLLLFEPTRLVALLVGFFDAWVDYRSRFSRPSTQSRD